MAKIGTTSVLFAILALVMSSVASAITVTIDEVQVDDTVVFLGSTNRLDVTRPGELELEIRMSATQNVRNMEIQAFLSGYEHNTDERMEAVTPLFDADANVTYVKKLTIKLPDEADEDDYLLRIIATDRNTAELVQNYRLKIDVDRHSLQIEDVILSPSNEVKAGSALLATVRLDNKGEKDEDDVKVTVSIPALGLSASDYIDEIENDEQEETEELYIRVPRCVKAGTYDVDVEVEYNDFHDTVSAKQQIDIVQDDSCSAAVSVTQPVQPAVAPVTPVAPQPPVEPQSSSMSKLRNALEIALLVLVGILVLVGLIVGFSKLKEE